MFSKIALYTLIKSIFAQHKSCRSLKDEQLSFWALFHLSFSLKVIAVLQLGPWNFWKLQISPDSSTSCLLACSAPLAAAAVQHRPPHWAGQRPPPARAGLPRAAPELPPLFYPSRWSFLALPRTLNRTPATTSPPSWLAHCSTPGPQLARALAPRAPHHSIPLFPSPLPRPQTPEHHPPSPLPPLSRVSPWSHHPSHP